jgi:CRP-like cAMP-binding protein
MTPAVDVLAEVPDFASLGPSDLEALSFCFRGRRLAPGEVVFREGDPGSSLFVIGEGALAATVRAGTSARTLRRFGRGELVGATTLVDPAPRWTTLSAAGDTVVYELDADALPPLRQSAPAAARAVVAAGIRGLVGLLRGLDQRIDREMSRRSGP